MHERDTIAAIASAAGRGGIGIVRLSGPRARHIAERICKRGLRPRQAHHVRFHDREGAVVDDGIALLFVAPASYTGEDVVELQAHGSPVVLHEMLEACCALGARRARAGEFSERAWENGRLDLAQAEAVADLIAAADLRAARAARRSLEGEFSQRVDALAHTLIALRVQLEASIDFSDEELDADGEAALRRRLDAARGQLAALLAAAEQGRRLRDGLHAVIVGPPNAGKSSLLNALAGSDRAIVTDMPGTTRDLLQETIRVDGIELTLVDTAGLREQGDAIEREGMRRARNELARADAALVVLDARDPEAGRAAVESALAGVPEVVWLLNKRDLLPSAPAAGSEGLLVSARTGEGLEALHARLRSLAGGGGEGAFSARARHVEALRHAHGLLGEAAAGFASARPELAADSLRRAHDALGEITGRVLPDALLGHIFATFCIGK
ncbi:tRNA uridine-5-carboxymethylaminomethyl(34) synthesis GTPase MnmE [Pseudoluteimonas lycopersici]|uniref:tRNA modification GTPase MnmE n=1 Tax=Pseudoluteimonas lycopersici TaxID=1324796 RepID=A0A516V6C4_9GAMM|nr:tRNA uridine-5-carboxymethylaminomethyl(34) synthesis GTPase MnmE [Lysobacter lycopersici]QDQ74067.1 tRNA uridine-5-carboxymethylaminomethyl(34) synthesis GTPase MnmE [Lysobacter lycopersici]